MGWSERLRSPATINVDLTEKLYWTTRIYYYKLYLHGAAVFESLLQGVDVPKRIIMTEDEEGKDFQERMMTDYDDGQVIRRERFDSRSHLVLAVLGPHQAGCHHPPEDDRDEKGEQL